MKNHYTPTTKITDILKDNFRRPDIFALIGIKSGSNDDLPALEICKANGVDIGLFLLISNLYTFDDYSPEEEIENGFPVIHAIDYISCAHRFYVNVNAADIKASFDKVRPGLSDSHKTAVTELFDIYHECMDEHITDIDMAFTQYGENSRLITVEQIKHIIGQEAKIKSIVDTITTYLTDLSFPDEYKLQVDYLRYYLTFLRRDYDIHDIIKNATLKRIVNQA